jgi:hypothetical protein
MQQRQKPQQPDQNFPLAGIVMDFLRKDQTGKEPMAFCRQGREAIDVGLQALFASGRPALPPLSDLLGLATALEAQGSPSAARMIRAAVRRNPNALKALGVNTTDHALARRGATRLMGTKAQEQAPVFGASAPKGTIAVAKLVDPMQFDRARAQKIAKPAAAPTLQKAPTPPPSNRRKIA